MKAEVEMKVEMEFPLLSSDVLTCVLFLFLFFGILFLFAPRGLCNRPSATPFGLY